MDDCTNFFVRWGTLSLIRGAIDACTRECPVITRPGSALDVTGVDFQKSSHDSTRPLSGD